MQLTVPSPSQTTPETLPSTGSRAAPIIGIAGLLNLLTRVERMRAAAGSSSEGGALPCLAAPPLSPLALPGAGQQAVGPTPAGQSPAAAGAAEPPARAPTTAASGSDAGGER